MESKGTRLITIIIVAIAVIVSIVLIVILDGAERSAIAAATSDNTVLNPVIGSQEPQYEHDDFLSCSAIYQKENNKVICYIQNTNKENYAVNYTLSYKDANNHEIGHATGKMDELMGGDYRFAIVDKDIPANTAKVDLYAKASALSTRPFKVQVVTQTVQGNVSVSTPAYDIPVTLGEIQVCWMDANNGIIDVQIYPYTDNVPANTARDLGSLPLGTAKQLAISIYGHAAQ